VVDGLNKEEAQKHLSRGNQLLNAGQLAEALTHYHAAIGKSIFSTIFVSCFYQCNFCHLKVISTAC